MKVNNRDKRRIVIKTTKITKTLLSLCLVFALIITMTGVNKTRVLADDYTITITDSSNDAGTHTYEAYKIFDITVNGTEVTVDDWAEGVNGAALLDSLKNDATIGTLFTDCIDASDVAQVLSDATNFPSDTAADVDADSNIKALTAIIAANLSTVAGTSTVSGNDDVITVGSQGYYFIQDANAPTLAGGTNSGAYTRFILQVVSDVQTEVAAKTDAPSVVKKVYENNCTYDTYGAGFNDVADYETGEDVSFKIIVTLPTNVSAYDTYKLVFEDELDDHFGEPENIALSVDGTAVTTGFTSSGRLTVTVNDIFAAAGATTDDAKAALNDKEVVLTYTAQLLTTAEVGTGYENSVSILYSNNPNDSGEGNNNTGETPEDKVIVFTYGGDFTKVDAGNAAKKLGGAEFVLTDSTKAKYAVIEDGKVSSWTTDKDSASLIVSGNDGTFAVAGLDSETIYYLEEIEAPEGYKVPDAPYVAVNFDQIINITQNWDGTQAGAIENGSDATDFTAPNANITNTKLSATLPTTGGIGTTVFYVCGIILMLGAAVLLIARKRTNKE